MKKSKSDIVPAVDVIDFIVPKSTVIADEVSRHWQVIAEKWLAANKLPDAGNQRWTTAKSVATLLRAATGKPTHLFTDEYCPFYWADYPEGYSVFHTTIDIHAKQRPVAVYYKGLTSSTELKNARKILTGAGLGFVCPPPTKGSSTSQSRLVVTKKPVAVGGVV